MNKLVKKWPCRATFPPKNPRMIVAPTRIPIGIQEKIKPFRPGDPLMLSPTLQRSNMQEPLDDSKFDIIKTRDNL